MLDILYLTHNRREFTEASLAALEANTNWNLVRYLWLYDDRSVDGTAKLLRRYDQARIVERPFGGPVAAMLDFIGHSDAPALFAKIDNDVILPPGWLDVSLGVMEAHHELDLLGIEPPASRTQAPWALKRAPAPEQLGPYAPALGHTHAYAPCDCIGGIGLMRTAAFCARAQMRPHSENGVGGFTDWQQQNKSVRKGWIVPPLEIFLLDRLPMEPWASLSREYIAKGWQRRWTNYRPEDSALWAWWQAAVATA